MPRNQLNSYNQFDLTFLTLDHENDLHHFMAQSDKKSLYEPFKPELFETYLTWLRCLFGRTT
jgi:hypothetical protein